MLDFIFSSEDLKDGKIWAVKLVDLSGLVESKLEARRLISQGVVVIDGKRIMDVNEDIEVKDGMIIKLGEMLSCKINLVKSEK
jgi:tyrosyl-tRNA synthetase